MPDGTAARNGDLFVDVHVAAASASIAGKATICTCVIPIGVHEAVLGARIDVPTLDGPIRLAHAARHAGGTAVPY